MVIAQLVATGINIKVIEDIRRDANYKKLTYDFWTMPTSYDIEPLMPEHLMLSFILCMIGLSIALIVFVIESLCFKNTDKELFLLSEQQIEMSLTRKKLIMTLAEHEGNEIAKIL